MDHGGGGVPQRSNKQMLTLIPETDRSIDYRFEFCMVGVGARDFAEKAVQSEMAEAFRPTAAKNKVELEKLEEGDEEEEGDLSPAAAGKKTDRKENRSGTDGDKPQETLILFCPIGESRKALARVRFTCVEQFSQSLPLTRDAQLALNQAIVFLFAPEIAEKCDGPPIDEFRSDFLSRFAEIKHTPQQFRPHCRILAIEAEPDALDTIEQIGKTQNVAADVQPDGAEDSIMEALQEICDHLIKIQTRTVSVMLTPRTGAAVAETAKQPSKSKACMLL